jgi:NADH-quinone oxidoreductase subunit J
VSTVVFFLAGAFAIATAVAVVAQRNPFISALALLGNLASLAALMLLLEAQFLAAAQIIVYAGAIMVMFLFVIAYVGPKSEIGSAAQRPWQLALAVLAGALIVVQVIAVVFSAGFGTAVAVDGTVFGGPQEVGRLLIVEYILAFEIASVILFMAAVAGVVLGGGRRPRRLTDEEVLGKEQEAAEARRLDESRALRDAAREAALEDRR